VEYRIPELVQVQIHEKGLGVKRKRGLSIYPSTPSPQEIRWSTDTAQGRGARATNAFCCRFSCRLTPTLSGIAKGEQRQITPSVNDLKDARSCDIPSRPGWTVVRP
jgi:hypothetical protein